MRDSLTPVNPARSAIFWTATPPNTDEALVQMTALPNGDKQRSSPADHDRTTMMMSPVEVEEPTVERRACHPSWRDIAVVAEQLRDRHVAGNPALRDYTPVEQALITE